MPNIFKSNSLEEISRHFLNWKRTKVRLEVFGKVLAVVLFIDQPIPLAVGVVVMLPSTDIWKLRVGEATLRYIVDGGLVVGTAAAL